MRLGLVCLTLAGLMTPAVARPTLTARPVTVRCRGQSLTSVIASVAHQVGLEPYIVSPLDERVTCDYRRQPAELVLDEMLGPAQVWVRNHHRLIVGTAEALRARGLDEEPLEDAFPGPLTEVRVELSFGASAYVFRLLSDGQQACWHGFLCDQGYAWCGNSYGQWAQGPLPLATFQRARSFAERAAWTLTPPPGFAASVFAPLPAPDFSPGSCTFRLGKNRFFRLRRGQPNSVVRDCAELLKPGLRAAFDRCQPAPALSPLPRGVEETVFGAPQPSGGQPLPAVLRRQAEQLRLATYLSPSVENCTCSLPQVDCDPRKALDQLVAGTGLAWRQCGLVLAVGPESEVAELDGEALAGSLYQGEPVRGSARLTRAAPDSVIPGLEQGYPDVRFGSGVEVTCEGPRQEVAAALRAIASLDVSPAHPLVKRVRLGQSCLEWVRGLLPGVVLLEDGPECLCVGDPTEVSLVQVIARDQTEAPFRISLRVGERDVAQVGASPGQSVWLSPHSLEVGNRLPPDSAGFTLAPGPAGSVDVQMRGKTVEKLSPGESVKLDHLDACPRTYRRSPPVVEVRYESRRWRKPTERVYLWCCARVEAAFPMLANGALEAEGELVRFGAPSGTPSPG